MRVAPVDGKIGKSWETDDEHCEGLWTDTDIPQCQTCHVCKGGPKVAKDQWCLVGRHVPIPNRQPPKARKGLEMGSGIGEA